MTAEAPWAVDPQVPFVTADQQTCGPLFSDALCFEDLGAGALKQHIRYRNTQLQTQNKETAFQRQLSR